MRIRLTTFALTAALVATVPLAAQESAVYRALDFEDAGRWEEAAAVYRQELRGPSSLHALFGLERSLLTLNRGEELAAVLAELTRERPQDEIARSMYVRTLLRLERRDAARAFVRQWMTDQPLEAEAYRQLYAIAPLTDQEARAVWRVLRTRLGAEPMQAVASEFTDHLLEGGLWSVAREVLEELFAGSRAPDVGERLAFATARAGDVSRARAVAREARVPDRSPALGWLAMYEGDLGLARDLLRRADEADRSAILPLALLSRTSASRAPAFGAALLQLARGDTAAAARGFTSASFEVPGAEPLLLAWAARLYESRRDWRTAGELHDRIVFEFPDAAEAPEAVLGQARTLVRIGSREAALRRFEDLILVYPESALVPVARRELDLLRGGVPPA